MKPAVRRSRNGKRKPRRGSGPGLSRLPTREEYVAFGVQIGGTREGMERQYDEWAATQGATHGDRTDPAGGPGDDA